MGLFKVFAGKPGQCSRVSVSPDEIPSFNVQPVQPGKIDAVDAAVAGQPTPGGRRELAAIHFRFQGEPPALPYRAMDC